MAVLLYILLVQNVESKLATIYVVWKLFHESLLQNIMFNKVLFDIPGTRNCFPEGIVWSFLEHLDKLHIQTVNQRLQSYLLGSSKLFQNFE